MKMGERVKILVRSSINKINRIVMEGGNTHSKELRRFLVIWMIE